MRKFVLKYPDGSVSIVNVVDGQLTNSEVIAKDAKYQTAVSNRDILDTDLIDATYIVYRDAFTDNGSGSLQIDMVKAKEVILEKLRQKRNSKLDDLDKIEFKASGTGDNVLLASVQQDKQALRDCTSTIKNIAVSGYDDYTTLDLMIAAAVLPATNN